ncbi:MAG: M20/M25/M40 family metallo-hydrolase [Dethiobacter sp.]|nr:M20/M25/M40 family metallo-hydrolase [Dethiobacter sp.]
MSEMSDRIMDWHSLLGEAVDALQFMISVDTSRGSETILAQYLRQLLLKDDLAADIYEPCPGRGSLVALLPGGPKPPLVLLSHLDTAPAKSSDWPFPPFAGVLRENMICGRGAIDCKGLAAVHMVVFMAVKRLGLKLDRDLYFVSTAGEEGGGHIGASWLLTHLPQLRRTGYVLGEGGGFTLNTGRELFQLCQVGEKGKLKISLQTELTKRRVDSLAMASAGKMATAFNLDLPLGLGEKLDVKSMTSNKVHTEGKDIIFEILPGVDPGRLLESFTKEICKADPQALITIKERTEGTLSDVNTPLYKELSKQANNLQEVSVTPFITPGYSDNRFFRGLGANVYGFQPLFPDCNPGWVHGTGERISTSSLAAGIKILIKTVTAVFS